MVYLWMQLFLGQHCKQVSKKHMITPICWKQSEISGFRLVILLLSKRRTQFFSWIQSYYACNIHDDVYYYIISKLDDLFFTKKRFWTARRITLTTFLVFLNLGKFLSHWRCSFHSFTISGKKKIPYNSIQFHFSLQTNRLLNVCLWELSSISYLFSILVL